MFDEGVAAPTWLAKAEKEQIVAKDVMRRTDDLT
jgi:hypothetical protein